MNKDQMPSIIACIDTTNSSKITLRYACLKAKKLGFAVQILSVIEPSHKNLLFGSHAIAKEKRNNVEKYLKGLIDEFYKESSLIPTVSIREGEIASEILKEIKSTPNCAMIIFGKSDNKKSDNNVLPRIAQTIGTKINIPTVIVPENLDNSLFQALIEE